MHKTAINLKFSTVKFYTLLCLAFLLISGHVFAEEHSQQELFRPGYVLTEDDIVLPQAVAQGRATYATNLWPNGVVPYQFESEVNQTNRNRVLQAMTEWETVSGVDFVARTNQADYIHIGAFGGNWSYIGKIGGRQDLSIYNWTYHYIIAHELAHALGMWHEQSRPDRDQYVQIHWENIPDDRENNFRLHSDAGMFGPYDYESIMHYSAYAFSSNGQPTITALSPYQDMQSAMGNRSYLSHSDKAGMAHLYPRSSSSSNLLTNGGFEAGSGGPAVISPWRFIPEPDIFACLWTTSYGGAYQGSKMLSTNRAVNSNCRSLIQDVSIAPQPGEVYTLSFYGRRGWDGAARQGRLVIWSLGPNQEKSETQFSLNGSWQCYSTTLNISRSGNTTIRSEIYFDSISHPDYQFDQIKLVRGINGCSSGTSNPDEPPAQITPAAGTTIEQAGNGVTFRWAQVAQVDWYHVQITNNNTVLVDQWLNGNQVCLNGSCVLPSRQWLANGDYTWYLAAGNSLETMSPTVMSTFTVSVPSPSLITGMQQNAVNADISQSRLSWQADDNALWYQVIALGPDNQTLLNSWQEAERVCNMTDCSMLSQSSQQGDYSWYIRAWGPGGMTDYANSSFTIDPDAPEVIGRIGPSNTLTDARVGIQWHPGEEATWYHVYINGPGNFVNDQWYSRDEVCDLNLCEATYNTLPQNGTYTWYIQGWGSGGFGPWTMDGMNFALNVNVPPKVTQNPPQTTNFAIGEILMQWQAVPQASWYQLYIASQDGSYVHDAWYAWDDVCNGASCAAPVINLPGVYNSWMRAWGPNGMGPWNDGSTHTIE